MTSYSAVKERLGIDAYCWHENFMQIMDYASLPHFCRREGSGSSHHSENGTTDNCFCLDHVFHQHVYNYVNQQAALVESVGPWKQGSFHVAFPEPDPEGKKIAKTIESEFHKIGDHKNGLSNSMSNLKVNDDWNFESAGKIDMYTRVRDPSGDENHFDDLYEMKGEWGCSLFACLHHLNAAVLVGRKVIWCNFLISMLPPMSGYLYHSSSIIYQPSKQVCYALLGSCFWKQFFVLQNKKRKMENMFDNWKI